MTYLKTYTKLKQEKTMKYKANILNIDTKNENGRIYPKDLVEKAVLKYNENKEQIGLGTLEFQDTLEMDPNNISHKISNVRIEENNVVCDVKLLNTPKGKLVQDLLKDMQLSVATAGTGRVDKDGVVTEFELHHTAIISNPSGDNQQLIKIEDDNDGDKH